MDQQTDFEKKPTLKLTQFEVALKGNKKACALKLLSVELLEEKDSNGKHVMHFAAQYLEAIFFQQICLFVKENKPSLLFSPDNQGETPLHVAVKFCQPIAIHFLLKTLDKQAEHAAKMVTNKGSLPIDYVHLRSQEVIDPIIKSLIPLMQKNNLCHPDKKLDIKAILEEYKQDCKEDPCLADHLRIVVEAMNDMPKLRCATHPNSEEKNREQLTKEMKLNNLHVFNGCHQLHIKNLTKTFCHTFENVTESIIDHYRLIDILRLRDILHFRADYYSKNKKANCSQQADILLKILFSKSPSLYAEKMQIKNGDHALIAVNRDPLNDITQFRKRMIFADPFARVICLARDYSTKLQYYLYYQCHDVTLDIVGPLNLNYHIITPYWIHGAPYSYFSDLTLLLSMDDDDKRKFFLARDDENRTILHRMAGLCELLRCKIFLYLLYALKDIALTKKTFSAIDMEEATILHTSIRSADVLTVTLFLNEYINLFGNKLTEKIILTHPQENSHKINQILFKFFPDFPEKNPKITTPIEPTSKQYK